MNVARSVASRCARSVARRVTDAGDGSSSPGHTTANGTASSLTIAEGDTLTIAAVVELAPIGSIRYNASPVTEITIAEGLPLSLQFLLNEIEYEFQFFSGGTWNTIVVDVNPVLANFEVDQSNAGRYRVIVRDTVTFQEYTLQPVTVTVSAETVTPPPNDVVPAIAFTTTGTTGTYADGSPWVVGSLTAMAPAFATGVSRTLANGTVIANTEVHGWMVDPGNAERYKTGDLSTLALRQAANYGVGAGLTNQAYDSLVIGTNHAYAAANKTALPITAGSVVKARSRITGVNNSGRPTLDNKSIITLVGSEPTAGSIRPPVARADKTPLLNTSQIILSRLRNLTMTGVPAYQTLLNWLGGTHTWQHSRNVNSRNILPQNGLGLDPYFGTTAVLWSQVLLALHSNSLTTEQKTNLLIQVGKIAGDIAAAVNEGRVFSPNGGHSIGRLPILAFAAEVFDNAYLRAAAGQTVLTGLSGESDINQSVFGDLGQLYYITQGMIDDSVGELYPFPQASLGYPAWGSQYSIRPNEWASGNIFGIVASGTDNTGITNALSYRQIAGKSYTGGSLAIRLLQDGSTPNVPDLYHDYADRYAGWAISGSYVFGTAGPVDPSNPTPAWVLTAYTAHSSLVSVWTP